MTYSMSALFWSQLPQTDTVCRGVWAERCRGRKERIKEGRNVRRKQGSQKNKIKAKLLTHFYYCFIS